LRSNFDFFRFGVLWRYFTNENYVKMRVMPTPRLRSIKGQEFFCSLCEAKFKAKLPQPKQATVKEWEDPILKEWQRAVAETKAALLKEWDEHLHGRTSASMGARTEEKGQASCQGP
jgi:hypothetical protein